MAKKIRIFHLYPEAMNLYGDLGNIITLQKRCEWRGIEAEIVNVGKDQEVDFASADLIFMGGGQDSGQKNIADDLLKKGEKIKKEIEEGLPALLVCGGFQLFGSYFQTKEGDKLQGISVFDAFTVAGEKRLIGNVVADIAHEVSRWQQQFNSGVSGDIVTTLVGFENHSGQTTIQGQSKPLGYVIRGFGNKGDGGYEGAVYKNAFGTYLHGSLLPKNPWLADHLITCALYRRYGNVEELAKLDDTIELAAHKAAIDRSKTAKTVSI